MKEIAFSYQTVIALTLRRHTGKHESSNMVFIYYVNTRFKLLLGSACYKMPNEN